MQIVRCAGTLTGSSQRDRSESLRSFRGGVMSKDDLHELLEQYGCGPIQFTGTNDALYERHLIFDDVIDPKKADQREQFEAAARSLRDIISQRWLQTERTYEKKNPKRVYYLSLEFLLGRSLANNITNT